jgi:ribosomal protein L17
MQPKIKDKQMKSLRSVMIDSLKIVLMNMKHIEATKPEIEHLERLIESLEEDCTHDKT